MCVRWDGGTPTCSSKMQVGRLAVKSSTQRPHCKSLEHAETVADPGCGPRLVQKPVVSVHFLCLLWALIGCSSQSSTSGPVLRRMLSAGQLPPCPFGPGRTTPRSRTAGAKAGRDSPERGRPWKCRSAPHPSEPSVLTAQHSAGRSRLWNDRRLESDLARLDSQQAPNASSKTPRKMANKLSNCSFLSVSVPSVVPSDRTMGGRSVGRLVGLSGAPSPSTTPSARGRPHIAAPGLP